MFLDLLNQHQLEILRDAVVTAAHLDGTRTADEDLVIDAIDRGAPAAELRPPEVRDVPELSAAAVEAFADEPVAARAFVLELAGVIVADLDEHGKELDLLGQVAGALRIAEDEQREALRFAHDARDLALRGQRLLSTGVTG